MASLVGGVYSGSTAIGLLNWEQHDAMSLAAPKNVAILRKPIFSYKYHTMRQIEIVWLHSRLNFCFRKCSDPQSGVEVVVSYPRKKYGRLKDFHNLRFIFKGMMLPFMTKK